MVLDFPMRSDYALMDVDQHHFFMTHGHLFNEDQLPLLNENDILIYGHFHKPLAKKENGIYILNPSSISLPKEGTIVMVFMKMTVLQLKHLIMKL